jgi:peptidyl-tRNA hydrolase
MSATYYREPMTSGQHVLVRGDVKQPKASVATAGAHLAAATVRQAKSGERAIRYRQAETHENGDIQLNGSMAQAVTQVLVDLLVNGKTLHFDQASGTVLLTDASYEHGGDQDR